MCLNVIIWKLIFFLTSECPYEYIIIRFFDVLKLVKNDFFIVHVDPFQEVEKYGLSVV